MRSIIFVNGSTFFEFKAQYLKWVKGSTSKHSIDLNYLISKHYDFNHVTTTN